MPMKARAQAYDAAKGIGILLVVFFHTYRGILESGGKLHDTLLPALDYITYCFHMPLFFISSGVFVNYSLRAGFPHYLRSKLVHIYYPYVLWSVITILTSALLAKYVNSPKELSNILLIPVLPRLHFWFLLTLFVYYLVYALIRDLRLLAVVAAVGLILHDLLGAPYQSLNYTHFFAFFVFGVGIGKFKWQIQRKAWWIAFLALVGWSMAGYLHQVDNMSTLMVPAGLAGFYLTMAIGDALQGSRLGRMLIFLGERSLAIYLLHVIAAAGTRIAMHGLGCHVSPYLLLLICSLAGVLIPLTAYGAAERFGLLTVSGLGRDRASTTVGDKRLRDNAAPESLELP